ncbi:hypothetical protein HMPREF0105_3769 [Bacteroides sp. 3_1_33FAA]|nr:hypothetical protein HMPREF0105_3769 [Bacteroides sp. 3_1_33FAA]
MLDKVSSFIWIMHYISAFIPYYISFIIINGRKLTQYGMKTGFYGVIEC